MEKYVTYIPEPCTKEDAIIKGHVVLRVPSYEERAELGIESEFFSISSMPEEDKTKATIKCMVKLVKASYPFYSKIAFDKIDGSKVYKELDDLRMDYLCSEILQDIAMKLVKGLDLGNA